MYVAARAEQPGPAPPVVVGRPAWMDATTEPVGIQHATASERDDGEPGPEGVSEDLQAGKPCHQGPVASGASCGGR
jgi:hypothetical protein